MIKVHLKNIGETPEVRTGEFTAASQLKDKFEEYFLCYPNATGDVYILTNIRIFAQKRNDIDILIFGFLDGMNLSNIRIKNGEILKKLQIKSFVSNIELKSHPAQLVSREGNNYWVTYGIAKHNASQQCVETKFSLVNHLSYQLGISPFICDVLWLNGLSNDDLATVKQGDRDNALPSGFSFRDYIECLMLQADARLCDCGEFSLDTFIEGRRNLKKILNLFTEKRDPKGLTRKKFELISQKLDQNRLLDSVGKKLSIITGRAGTGKTIQLLQLAFSLASENVGKRCLILTYNNALVSDIRRLIDYTNIPTRIDGRTVMIRTIDSFFQSLMKVFGIIKNNINPNQDNYRELYEKKLKELSDYIIISCSSEEVYELRDCGEQNVDWDYILIDEAQDFTDVEKKVLLNVYGPERISVADGVDQFMRMGKKQNWESGIDENSIVKHREMILERRQKANLVTFVNAFAEINGVSWMVKPNTELPGGIIKIYDSYNSNIHSALIDNCKENECENYDILILEPPTMVCREDGKVSFAKAESYKEANISIYDGINPNNRTTYPTKDECRVYQYHSCRGLEGWCVVCDKFDELIDYKLKCEPGSLISLGLDEDLNKWRNAILWSLMPLTSPIDTLVITLSDKNSKVGKSLKELSDRFPDFVEWNIKQ